MGRPTCKGRTKFIDFRIRLISHFLGFVADKNDLIFKVARVGSDIRHFGHTSSKMQVVTVVEFTFSSKGPGEGEVLCVRRVQDREEAWAQAAFGSNDDVAGAGQSASQGAGTLADAGFQTSFRDRDA